MVDSVRSSVKLTPPGCFDILILAPVLKGGPVLGQPRTPGEVLPEDKERLKKEGIPENCWNDEVKILEAKFLRDFLTLRSDMYAYDRDEVDIYSVVNIKATEDMTIGSATDAIVDLLQNTQKGEGKSATNNASQQNHLLKYFIQVVQNQLNLVRS